MNTEQNTKTLVLEAARAAAKWEPFTQNHDPQCWKALREAYMAGYMAGCISRANTKSLVRPEFVAQMESELQANQHKGDWSRWYPTALQVLAEIQHHQGKLMLALSDGDCERVKEYAADLANFAMKADEQYGGPKTPEAAIPHTP